MKKAITPIEAVAIGCCISDDNIKQYKRDIVPGVYSGKVAVEIEFMISKAASHMAAPTADLLSKAVIARAMVLMGSQRDNFMKVLREAAEQALGGNGKVGDAASEDARVLEQLDKLQKEVIAKLPLKEKSGGTRVIATVSKVAVAEIATPLKKSKAA
jgi:hypothetical protein